MTRVGELEILALPSLSEVSATRADRASLDLSEESVTTASSMAASCGSLTGVAVRYPSGSLDLSEESATRVGSAVSTIPADRVTLGLDSLGMLIVFSVA
jgi:hypothetical protein